MGRVGVCGRLRRVAAAALLAGFGPGCAARWDRPSDGGRPIPSGGTIGRDLRALPRGRMLPPLAPGVDLVRNPSGDGVLRASAPSPWAPGDREDPADRHNRYRPPPRGDDTSLDASSRLGAASGATNRYPEGGMPSDGTSNPT